VLKLSSSANKAEQQLRKGCWNQLDSNYHSESNSFFWSDLSEMVLRINKMGAK
jgi:hypothetical protein